MQSDPSYGVLVGGQALRLVLQAWLQAYSMWGSVGSERTKGRQPQASSSGLWLETVPAQLQLQM